MIRRASCLYVCSTSLPSLDTPRSSGSSVAANQTPPAPVPSLSQPRLTGHSATGRRTPLSCSAYRSKACATETSSPSRPASSRRARSHSSCTAVHFLRTSRLRTVHVHPSALLQSPRPRKSPGMCGVSLRHGGSRAIPRRCVG